MRILSPVDRADEAEDLIDAGAEELYAGYVPPFWSDRFGPVVTCNRRSFAEASLVSMKELDLLIREAALREVPVHLAINASPVPEEMIPPMTEFAVDLARRGVRGLIVSDLALLLALREARFRRLELHASTLFSPFNGGTAAFLRRAGASRVILARELSTRAIAAMVAALPDLPLEVIGLRGRCPNIEGFCTHLHDDPDRAWPCELRYRKGWQGDAPAPPRGVIEAISREEGTDRHFSCGLCAVPLLERAGVHAFKLVGRGAETERKAAAVADVREMREWGREALPDAAACARKGKERFERMHGRRCRIENCYFPEFRPGEE